MGRKAEVGKCFVYWLHDNSCTDPSVHGYIGVTARPKKRAVEHRRSGKLPDNFIMTIIHEGTVDECFAVEEQMRPQHRVGWNNLRGGHHRNHSLGSKYKPEAGRKISAALKGKCVSDKHREKISSALKGHVRTDQSRARQSLAMRGRHKSIEHRAAMSAAAKRRYSDPDERVRMSEAVKAGKARAKAQKEMIDADLV